VLATLLLPVRSYATDPAVADCLAANEDAISLRNEQKLRAARSKLLVCAAQSCPLDVRKECTRRIEDLNAAMPTIVFEARDAAGRDLATVKVLMDGETLAEHLGGTALSVDPGEHTFVFETAGAERTELSLLIREGDRERRERVMFRAPAPPTHKAPPAGKAAVSHRPVASPPPGAAQEATLGTQKILALTAAGIGLVGLGIGTAYGLKSIAKHDEASQACPHDCSDQNGVELWNEAQTAGDIATVGFVVGAAGLVGGAVLWFTAKPESSSTKAQLAIGPRVVVVRGSW
jgi:hypothetical protein